MAMWLSLSVGDLMVGESAKRKHYPLSRDVAHEKVDIPIGKVAFVKSGLTPTQSLTTHLDCHHSASFQNSTPTHNSFADQSI
jgi:hypothetical protein